MSDVLLIAYCRTIEGNVNEIFPQTIYIQAAVWSFGLVARGTAIWGDEFRKVREQLFLTQAEFAQRLEISLGGVQRIEQQFIASVLPKTLRKLAEAAKADPAGLLDRIGVPAEKLHEMQADGSLPISSDSVANIVPGSETRAFAVPLFDLPLAAGPWASVADTGMGRDDSEVDRGVFRVRLRGDSMAPTYRDGQVVEFQCLRDPVFVAGKDYYVQRGDEATFKRVVGVEDETLTLVAINKKKYPKPMRVQRSLILRAAVAVAKVDLI